MRTRIAPRAPARSVAQGVLDTLDNEVSETRIPRASAAFDSGRLVITRARFFLASKADKQLEHVRRPAASLVDAPEDRLVAEAQALHDAAWAELYRRHAQQVYAYILFRIGDHHAAEDLAADVFVKAIAGIRGYEYRGTPLLAWLYRIAHNVTADYRVAVARRSRFQAGGDAADVEERRDRLAALDERADMLEAIRALTDEQQQVVLLRFYHGLTNAEVADVMCKEEGAVKAQQTRALRSLRRILTEGRERQASA